MAVDTSVVATLRLAGQVDDIAGPLAAQMDLIQNKAASVSQTLGRSPSTSGFGKNAVAGVERYIADSIARLKTLFSEASRTGNFDVFTNAAKSMLADLGAIGSALDGLGVAEDALTAARKKNVSASVAELRELKNSYNEIVKVMKLAEKPQTRPLFSTGPRGTAEREAIEAALENFRSNAIASGMLLKDNGTLGFPKSGRNLVAQSMGELGGWSSEVLPSISAILKGRLGAQLDLDSDLYMGFNKSRFIRKAYDLGGDRSPEENMYSDKNKALIHENWMKAARAASEYTKSLGRINGLEQVGLDIISAKRARYQAVVQEVEKMAQEIGAINAKPANKEKVSDELLRVQTGIDRYKTIQSNIETLGKDATEKNLKAIHSLKAEAKVLAEDLQGSFQTLAKAKVDAKNGSRLTLDDFREEAARSLETDTVALQDEIKRLQVWSENTGQSIRDQVRTKFEGFTAKHGKGAISGLDSGEQDLYSSIFGTTTSKKEAVMATLKQDLATAKEAYKDHGNSLRRLTDMTAAAKKAYDEIGTSIGSYVRLIKLDPTAKYLVQREQALKHLKQTLIELQEIQKQTLAVGGEGAASVVTVKMQKLLEQGNKTFGPSAMQGLTGGDANLEKLLADKTASKKKYIHEANLALTEQIETVKLEESVSGRSYLAQLKQLKVLHDAKKHGIVLDETNKKTYEELSKVATPFMADMVDYLQRVVFWQMKWQMGLGLIFGTLNLVKGGIAEMAAYEQALRNIEQITQATAEETAHLDLVLRELGRSTIYSANQLSSVMLLLGQAGVNAEDAAVAMESITKLSIATMADLNKTADLVTSIMTSFDRPWTQAAETANLLAAATNDTKLTIENMAGAFNYVGNTAHLAGVSLSETAAAMGALANHGTRMSTIGTGLRGLLGAMLAPTDNFYKALRSAGLSMSDINVKSLGLVEVLRRMRASGFSVADAFAGLDKRMASSAATVVANYDEIARLNGSIQGTNRAFTMFEKQMEPLENSFKKLGNRFKDLALEVGEGVLPVFSTLISALNGLFDVFYKLGDIVPLSVLGKSTLVFMTLSGAVVGVTMALSKLAAAGKLLTPVISVLTVLKRLLFGAPEGMAGGLAVAGAAASPLAWAAAGVAAIGTLVYAKLEYEKESNKAKLEAAAKSMELSRAYDTEIESLEKLREKLKAAGNDTAKQGVVVKELSSLLPELIVGYKAFGAAIYASGTELQDLDSKILTHIDNVKKLRLENLTAAFVIKADEGEKDIAKVKKLKEELAALGPTTHNYRKGQNPDFMVEQEQEQNKEIYAKEMEFAEARVELEKKVSAWTDILANLDDTSRNILYTAANGSKEFLNAVDELVRAKSVQLQAAESIKGYITASNKEKGIDKLFEKSQGKLDIEGTFEIAKTVEDNIKKFTDDQLSKGILHGLSEGGRKALQGSNTAGIKKFFESVFKSMGELGIEANNRFQAVINARSVAEYDKAVFSFKEALGEKAFAIVDVVNEFEDKFFKSVMQKTTQEIDATVAKLDLLAAGYKAVASEAKLSTAARMAAVEKLNTKESESYVKQAEKIRLELQEIERNKAQLGHSESPIDFVIQQNTAMAKLRDLAVKYANAMRQNSLLVTQVAEDEFARITSRATLQNENDLVAIRVKHAEELSNLRNELRKGSVDVETDAEKINKLQIQQADELKKNHEKALREIDAQAKRVVESDGMTEDAKTVIRHNALSRSLEEHKRYYSELQSRVSEWQTKVEDANAAVFEAELERVRRFGALQKQSREKVQEQKEAGNRFAEEERRNELLGWGRAGGKLEEMLKNVESEFDIKTGKVSNPKKFKEQLAIYADALDEVSAGYKRANGTMISETQSLDATQQQFSENLNELAAQLGMQDIAKDFGDMGVYSKEFRRGILTMISAPGLEKGAARLEALQKARELLLTPVKGFYGPRAEERALALMPKLDNMIKTAEDETNAANQQQLKDAKDNLARIKEDLANARKEVEDFAFSVANDPQYQAVIKVRLEPLSEEKIRGIMDSLLNGWKSLVGPTAIALPVDIDVRTAMQKVIDSQHLPVLKLKPEVENLDSFAGEVTGKVKMNLDSVIKEAGAAAFDKVNQHLEAIRSQLAAVVTNTNLLPASDGKLETMSGNLRLLLEKF